MAARRSRGRSRSKIDREFISEAEEILERMRGDLSALAEQAGSGAADPQLIHALFRSAHSLKGLSGMFGLDGMSELAHHLEGMLDRLRLGRAHLDAAALSLFDESTRLVSGLLGKLDDEPARSEAERNIAELVQRIDGWSGGADVAEPPGTSADLDPAILRALTEYEEHRLRESMRLGRTILSIDTQQPIASFEAALSELSTAAREHGELLSTLPSPGDAPEAQIRFSLLVASDWDPAALAVRLGVDARDVRALWSPQPAPDVAPQSGHVSPAGSDAPPMPDPDSLRSISDTVRVDIRKLDELMNLVGELSVQRVALGTVAARLQSRVDTRALGTELQKVHKLLERKLQELQSGVLDVRMVPLQQVFDKLTRVVRRLKVDLGKDVRLVVQGAETELDKLIVEELVDPLMHLVRNAFDHAIEPAEERRAAGKPREGCIRLEASQRGSDVVLAVADDGRGIDPGEILRRATEGGLVAEGAELSDKEVLALVLQPGFSTRSEVTETSGRGVGMDVVRANIAALGGAVDIESSVGRGTTITLTLPITLAIIQSLIVSVSGARFAIPLNSVRETLCVDAYQIQRSEGRELMNLRGEPLLLRHLGEQLELGAPRAEKHYAVVLAVGSARLGLLVDDLEGQLDTVVKPIQGPVTEVRGIAGATDLGEQGTVLVLDVAALVEDAAQGRGVS